MTKPECLQLFALLAAAYPKEPMTEAQVTLYTQMLAPYDGLAVRGAVLLHIQQSPWFPRLSDVVDRLTKRDQLDPDEAWREVVTAIRRVGMYRTPSWSHPALAETVAALGWNTLCESENPEADRAHFLRFYASAATRQREQTLVDQLSPAMRDALHAVGQSGTPRVAPVIAPGRAP